MIHRTYLQPWNYGPAAYAVRPVPALWKAARMAGLDEYEVEAVADEVADDIIEQVRLGDISPDEIPLAIDDMIGEYMSGSKKGEAPEPEEPPEAPEPPEPVATPPKPSMGPPAAFAPPTAPSGQPIAPFEPAPPPPPPTEGPEVAKAGVGIPVLPLVIAAGVVLALSGKKKKGKKR